MKLHAEGILQVIEQDSRSKESLLSPRFERLRSTMKYSGLNGWLVMLTLTGLFLFSACSGSGEEQPVTVVKTLAEQPESMVAYGKEFWKPQSLVNQGGEPNLSEIVQRADAAFRTDPATGAVQARVRGFKATVEKDGLRLSLPAAKKAKNGQGELEVSLGTAGIHQGDDALASKDAGGWSVLGNTAQRCLDDDGAVLEHYESRRDHLAVTWVLQHAPAGNGDLSIDYQIGDLVARKQTAKGWLFADKEGQNRLRLGPAVAVDAHGKRWKLQTTAQENMAQITLPETVLASAAFPLAVDPEIEVEVGLPNDPNGIGMSLVNDEKPVVVEALADGKLLVLWHGQGNDSLHGIVVDPTNHGQLVPPSTQIVQGGVSGPIRLARQGNSMVAVWQDDTTLKGALLTVDTDTLNSSLFADPLSPLDQSIGNADILPYGTTDFVTFWTDSLTETVWRRVIHADGSFAGVTSTASMPGLSSLQVGHLPSSDIIILLAGVEDYGVTNTHFLRLNDDDLSSIGAWQILVGNVQINDLACLNTSCMTIWQNESASPIKAGRIAHLDGNPTWVPVSDTVLASTLGAVAQSARVAVQNGNYLLSWGTEVDTGEITPFYRTWVQRYDGNGQAIDDVAITLSQSENPPVGMDFASTGDYEGYLLCPAGTTTNNEILLHQLDFSVSPMRRTDTLPVVLAQGLYDQQAPSVAATDDTFLIVWKSDVNYPTSGYDIFGLRLDRISGTPLETAGFAISQEQGDQGNPSVHSDGENFLVVWESLAVDTNGRDLVGRRVRATDGLVLDAAGIFICNAQGSQKEARLASDGSDYVVVWEDDRNDQADLYGTTVSSVTGSISPENGSAISALSTSDEKNVAIASNGNNFLVTWDDGTNVYATRMGEDLIPADSPALTIHTGVEPTVASDGTDYLLVFAEDLGSNQYDLRNQVVPGTGTMDNSVVDSFSGSGYTSSSLLSNPNLVRLGNSSEMLVIWEQNRGESGTLYGCAVHSLTDPQFDCSVDGTTYLGWLVDSFGSSPNLASGSLDKALLTFQKSTLSSSGKNLSAYRFISTSSCLIDSVSYARDVANSTDGCQLCDPIRNPSGWSNRLCQGVQICQSGACQDLPVLELGTSGNFTEDFEDESLWRQRFYTRSIKHGRIRPLAITCDTDEYGQWYYDSNHTSTFLAMDSDTNGEDGKSELVFALNLADVTQTMTLSFDHRSFHDEPHPHYYSSWTNALEYGGDGMAISTDGITWYRWSKPNQSDPSIPPFFHDNEADDLNWDTFSLTIDPTNLPGGLTASNPTYMMFFQRDNYPMGSDGDGRGFDNISVSCTPDCGTKICGPDGCGGQCNGGCADPRMACLANGTQCVSDVARVPFEEHFEDGLATFWEASSSGSNGHIHIEADRDLGPNGEMLLSAFDSQHSLVMDVSASGETPYRNELTLTLDTSVEKNLYLSYRFRVIGENLEPLPSACTAPSRCSDPVDGDGVLLATNAAKTEWVKLDDLIPVNRHVWDFRTIDLDQAYGSALPDQITIKFQQTGRDAWPEGGIVLDEVQVELGDSSCTPSCEGIRCGDDGCGGICDACSTDGNVCNGVEYCDTATNTCIQPEPEACNQPPNNGICYESLGTCDPIQGCIYQPKVEGFPCDTDNSLCTVGQCDGSGSCLEPDTVVCEEFQVCQGEGEDEDGDEDEDEDIICYDLPRVCPRGACEDLPLLGLNERGEFEGFLEDFENGTHWLEHFWAYSTEHGRIYPLSISETSPLWEEGNDNTSTFLAMDSGTNYENYPTNELVFAVSLKGANRPITLSFRQKSFADEPHATYHSSWPGTLATAGDGMAVSSDGSTWYRWSLDPSDPYKGPFSNAEDGESNQPWRNIEIENIKASLPAAVDNSERIYIKIFQRDNYPLGSGDGRGFDDIRISCTPDCTGKPECGPDGCGGQCNGGCSDASATCTVDYLCKATCTETTDCSASETCVDGLCTGLSCSSDSACDDNDPCTNDLCVNTECRHPFNTASCDDGNACTVDDVCSEGTCSGTTKSCDDGNVCTEDNCDGATGDCEHVNNTASCDDGNACTVDDTCSGGACVGTQVSCDDGNVCTEDSCDGATGQCTHTPICKCQQDAQCDDNNPCTDDSCDLDTGDCEYANNTASCDDGNACTVDDMCSEGTCSGTDIDCDDGNDETIDKCNPESGCEHNAKCGDDGACDDGLKCTIDTCSIGTGECTHTTNNSLCNDNNPCTNDRCDSELGCVFTPGERLTCDDGVECTMETCVDGQCVIDDSGCHQESTRITSLSLDTPREGAVFQGVEDDDETWSISLSVKGYVDPVTAVDSWAVFVDDSSVTLDADQPFLQEDRFTFRGINVAATNNTDSDEHIVRVRVTDVDEGILEAETAFIVDTKAPEIFVSGLNNDVLTVYGDTPSVYGTVVDGRLHSASIEYGNADESLLVPGSTFYHTFDTDQLTSGSPGNSVMITATDLVGNTNNLSFTVILGASEVVTISDCTPSTATAGVATNLSCVVAPNPGTTISQVFFNGIAATNDGSSDLWLSSLRLSDGDQQVTVLAVDESGGVTSHTFTVAVSNNPQDEPEDLDILSVSPEADEQEVPIDTPIVVNFNQALDPSTVTSGVVTVINDDGELLDTSLLLAPGESMLIVTPAGNLPYDSTLTVTVSKAILPANPPANTTGEMASDLTYSFQTRKPPTLLRGVVLHPFDGALEGVSVRMAFNGLSTKTDNMGNWFLYDVPEGPGRVLIDGSEVGFGHYVFNVEVTAHEVNSVQAVHLVPLVEGNSVYLDGTDRTNMETLQDSDGEGGFVTRNYHVVDFSTSIPNMRLLVPEGGARFLDGSSSGWLSASRVPPSIIPYKIAQGFYAADAVQISPLGFETMTDSRIEFPNIHEIPVGTKVMIFGYMAYFSQVIWIGTGDVVDLEDSDPDQPLYARTVVRSDDMTLLREFDLVGYARVATEEMSEEDFTERAKNKLEAVRKVILTTDEDELDGEQGALLEQDDSSEPPLPGLPLFLDAPAASALAGLQLLGDQAYDWLIHPAYAASNADYVQGMAQLSELWRDYVGFTYEGRFDIPGGQTNLIEDWLYSMYIWRTGVHLELSPNIMGAMTEVHHNYTIFMMMHGVLNVKTGDSSIDDVEENKILIHYGRMLPTLAAITGTIETEPIITEVAAYSRPSDDCSKKEVWLNTSKEFCGYTDTTSGKSYKIRKPRYISQVDVYALGANSSMEDFGSAGYRTLSKSFSHWDEDGRFYVSYNRPMPDAEFSSEGGVVASADLPYLKVGALYENGTSRIGNKCDGINKYNNLCLSVITLSSEPVSQDNNLTEARIVVDQKYIAGRLYYYKKDKRNDQNWIEIDTVGVGSTTTWEPPTTATGQNTLGQPMLRDLSLLDAQETEIYVFKKRHIDRSIASIPSPGPVPTPVAILKVNPDNPEYFEGFVYGSTNKLKRKMVSDFTISSPGPQSDWEYGDVVMNVEDWEQCFKFSQTDGTIPHFNFDPDNGWLSGSTVQAIPSEDISLWMGNPWLVPNWSYFREKEDAGQCWPRTGVSVDLAPGEELLFVAINRVTGYSGAAWYKIPDIENGSAHNVLNADTSRSGWYEDREINLGELQKSGMFGAVLPIALYPPDVEVQIKRVGPWEGGEQNVADPDMGLPSVVRNQSSGTTHDRKIEIRSRWRIPLVDETDIFNTLDLPLDHQWKDRVDSHGNSIAKPTLDGDNYDLRFIAPWMLCWLR